MLDVWKYICVKCDIQSIGRISRTCIMFNEICVTQDFWHRKIIEDFSITSVNTNYYDKYRRLYLSQKFCQLKSNYNSPKRIMATATPIMQEPDEIMHLLQLLTR